MYTKDNEIEETIAQMPRLEQRQYDLKSQLLYLSKVAIKLGLYDADDFLTNKKDEKYI